MSNKNLEILHNFNCIENVNEYELFLYNNIYNHFSVNEKNSEPEISGDENSEIYFKKEQSKLSCQIDPEESMKKNTIFFSVEKKETDVLKKYTGKKRGRKLNKEKKIMEKTRQKLENIHGKKDKFNILNKFNVHSINSLIDIVNCFLDMLKYDKAIRFLDINSNYKKDVKKQSIENLKNQKLCDILTLNISRKYHRYSLDYNKNLYKEIKNDPRCEVLINFLDENFLFFFQNVYYKNERTINLQKYGVDTFLTLSKEVELYIDKIKSFEDDKEYIKLCNQCINECYFNGKLMFQLEK